MKVETKNLGVAITENFENTHATGLMNMRVIILLSSTFFETNIRVYYEFLTVEFITTEGRKQTIPFIIYI